MADSIQSPEVRRRDRLPILAAAMVTTLDGFDAFSFNLVAPHIRADLGISTAFLGPIFASVMGGMILGATAGSALADRVGRLRVLLAAIVLFALAALALPFAANGGAVMLNRLVAGAGLGAAVPIAIGLLNRSVSKPPSEVVVALIMAGIPLGGCLAALFNYAVVPDQGWRSIFFAGGLLPLPVAAFAWLIFRGADQEKMTKSATVTAADIFRRGEGLVAAAIAAMFFFGYVFTAVISNWLPTLLNHRGASPLVVSATFGALNVGSIFGMLLLGLVASRTRLPSLLPVVWGLAALAGLATLMSGLETLDLALLAVVGATIAAGGQALSVALVNKRYRTIGVETTAIGLMTATGRLGQVSALGVSGLVISWSGQETMVFALAGAAAIVAAGLSVLAVRSSRVAIGALQPVPAHGPAAE